MPKLAIYALVFLTIVTSGCAQQRAGQDDKKVPDEKGACVEKPKQDCACTLQYDPVCGCNGKTYGNACEAECQGITQYTKGPCN